MATIKKARVKFQQHDDGLTCPCGKREKFSGYVYAHKNDPLTFTCECGRKYNILEFTAYPQAGPKSKRRK